MIDYKTGWEQVKILTFANMKARYRKTVVGFFWVVLNPIIMYSVQALVFKKFLRLDLPNYYVFLLGGLLPWVFINSSWDSSTSTIVNSSSLLKSFQISPLVILASAILDNFINFFAAFLILVIPTLIFTQTYSASLILLPVSVLLLVMFTAATTSLFATLHVFYRDVKYVTNFAMSVLFFLTPIFYPPSFVPEQYKWIISINPLYMVIRPFRACLYDGDFSSILIMQFKSLIFIALIFFVFAKFWEKKKNELFLKL